MASIAEIYPLQVLLATICGWMNRRQGEILEYLIEENRALKEQLKGKRLKLTDDQRRRLAAKGKRLGRRLLMKVATIVTPDTILRWHHRLIAAKWTYPAKKRVGRPDLMKAIRELILRFATVNSSWGYKRIEGALLNVGHTVSKTTIANVLKQHGIKPAPDRHSSWRVFLKAHWEEFGATDFFSTEVWTPSGLRTYYVLFFMELATRRVHVAGVTTNPTDWFMGQETLGSKDFLKSLRFMIHDNDTKYSLRFRIVMEDLGIKPIRTPYQAPNANAWAERFVRSIKEECLNRVILFGEANLRRCIDQYLEHYHRERNHQGLGNRLNDKREPMGEGKVVCSERLGGLLKFYSRAA